MGQYRYVRFELGGTQRQAACRFGSPDCRLGGSDKRLSGTVHPRPNDEHNVLDVHWRSTAQCFRWNGTAFQPPNVACIDCDQSFGCESVRNGITAKRTCVAFLVARDPALPVMPQTQLLPGTAALQYGRRRIVQT